MDWTPVVEAVVAEHAEQCPDAATPGHDWRYCERVTPVPAMARRMGVVTVTTTLAEREAERPPVVRDPALRVLCVCGHVRQNHTPITGSRCYASPCQCGADGGFRPVTNEETP